MQKKDGSLFVGLVGARLTLPINVGEKMFHRHKWQAIKTQNGLESYPWTKGNGSMVTIILSKCKECGSLKTENMDGWWTLDQLRGKG